MHFKNRKEAGKLLAEKLLDFKEDRPVIYALPRGGVPLGYEIAKALNASLDLVIARKIGDPLNPEYAICAISEDGEMICNEEELEKVDPAWFEMSVDSQKEEAKRRRKVYLARKRHISAEGKTAIIVDDGVATGLTVRAALRSLRRERPKRIVVAIPVIPHTTLVELMHEADEVVALLDSRKYLGAVGAYYESFPQVSDKRVLALLEKSREGSELKV
ncbi:MAG: phosphoribosyltransferase family protein [bacterium]|nr:phosphoribosyltransferase family protein [bacterium]